MMKYSEIRCRNNICFLSLLFCLQFVSKRRSDKKISASGPFLLISKIDFWPREGTKKPQKVFSIERGKKLWRVLIASELRQPRNRVEVTEGASRFRGGGPRKNFSKIENEVEKGGHISPQGRIKYCLLISMHEEVAVERYESDRPPHAFSHPIRSAERIKRGSGFHVVIALCFR